MADNRVDLLKVQLNTLSRSVQTMCEQQAYLAMLLKEVCSVCKVDPDKIAMPKFGERPPDNVVVFPRDFKRE